MELRTVTFRITGANIYAQNKPIEAVKEPKESNDDMMNRVWPERAHVNEKGQVVIPAMAITQSIREAARLCMEKVPRGGGAKWGNRFKTGIQTTHNPKLLKPSGNGKLSTKPFMKKDLVADKKMQQINNKGTTKLVYRVIPYCPEWEAECTCIVFDDVITNDIFERFAKEAGVRCGIGVHRQQNGGCWGSFRADNFVWS
jgi:hypothetical protein